MLHILSPEDFRRFIPDEEAAVQYFARFRWSRGWCPYCGCSRLYASSNLGKYKCSKCRRRFSLTVGTIFEETKLPIRTWLKAIWYVTEGPVGSTQLASWLGVTQKTAWKMLRRLSQASGTPSFKKQLIDDEEFDFRVVDAVAKLRGLGHQTDIKLDEKVLEELIEENPYVDPAKIRRWAMKQSWDFSTAARYEALAIRIKQKMRFV